MFRFISSNVFEIIAVMAVIGVIGVLIFAIRWRIKQDALEEAGDDMALSERSDLRDISLVSAGMAQTYETEKKNTGPETK